MRALGCVKVSRVMVNLTQCGIAWEESDGEDLSMLRLAWGYIYGGLP